MRSSAVAFAVRGSFQRLNRTRLKGAKLKTIDIYISDNVPETRQTGKDRGHFDGEIVPNMRRRLCCVGLRILGHAE